MSVETEERGAAGPLEPDHEAHQHAHPSDSTYIKVAVFLAVLTALEVGTYFIKDPSTPLLVALLFPMMIIKFAVVAGAFMHLRFDNPLFRRVFVFGLLLAVAVYVIVLTSMEYWSSSYGG
ncbi:MAG: cytochrome C oxidase subunit IV family protein [Acidimicrobiales bacterium]|nr:cytochrome C oxidase subunit IV family protein [Acidimicrobiales bacterium]